MPHIYIFSHIEYKDPSWAPFLHLSKLLIKSLICFAVIRATFGGFIKKKKMAFGLVGLWMIRGRNFTG